MNTSRPSSNAPSNQNQKNEIAESTSGIYVINTTYSNFPPYHESNEDSMMKRLLKKRSLQILGVLTLFSLHYVARTVFDSTHSRAASSSDLLLPWGPSDFHFKTKISPKLPVSSDQTQKHQVPIKIKSSRKYIHSLGIETCRFPKHFETSGVRKHYNLRRDNGYIQIGDWREENLALTGFDEKQHPQRVHDDLEKLRKYRLSKPHLPKIHRNITYVHIGKAGGSTVGCHLRYVWSYVSHHCEDAATTVIEEENRKHRSIQDTMLSQHVSCYTHWAKNLACYHIENVDFLVNVRHPLKRLASWFIYEHSENHAVVYPDREMHCGQIVLNSCYQNFHDMVTGGLSYPKPPPSQPLRVGFNLTQKECSAWAWNVVTGDMPADYHNAWNYQWYGSHILDKPESSIYALRVEHLEQDWVTVDRMLGGKGDFPTMMTDSQNTADEKELRVNNKTTTQVGIANLCRALCDEIQAYKQILTKAVNLQEEDLQTSLRELQEMCPDETDLQPRQCHYYD